MDITWQLQEAKQRFSEVVRRAEAGEPQIVTRHGEGVVVVLDIAEYRKLTGRETDFRAFLTAEPVLDDLEIVRDQDEGRQIDLTEVS